MEAQLVVFGIPMFVQRPIWEAVNNALLFSALLWVLLLLFRSDPNSSYCGPLSTSHFLEVFGIGIASATAIEATILAHEFAHVLSAKAIGIEIASIELTSRGGAVNTFYPITSFGHLPAIIVYSSGLLANALAAFAALFIALRVQRANLITAALLIFASWECLLILSNTATPGSDGFMTRMIISEMMRQ